MMLIFIKKQRRAGSAQNPTETKLVNASAEDLLTRSLTEELWDCAKSKDVSSFRNSIEALILNLFEEASEGSGDAA